MLNLPDLRIVKISAIITILAIGILYFWKSSRSVTIPHKQRRPIPEFAPTDTVLISEFALHSSSGIGLAQEILKNNKRLGYAGRKLTCDKRHTAP